MRVCAILLCVVLPAMAEDSSYAIAAKIKGEAFDRSQVMDTLSWLTDAYGPRLTGSPEFEEAANWAAGRLKGYGLDRVQLEKWGSFGRGWSIQHYSLEMIKPRYSHLIAAPLAWSAGTNGPVTGKLILAPLEFSLSPKKMDEILAKFNAEFHGKLKGKIVLVTKPKTTPLRDAKPLGRRYTDAELEEIGKAPTPNTKLPVKPGDIKLPEDPEELSEYIQKLPRETILAFYDKFEERIERMGKLMRDEGALAVIRTDGRAHDGLDFAEAAGMYKTSGSLAPPTFVLPEEQYNRLTRLIEKKVPVELVADLKVKISDGPVNGINIVGEIPGGSKKDELIMIGAHFDSWHTGTGATDNGAGSAVMIEVMRILKALNLKLDRTVRIALWSGEEQGLLGSRAYVKEHFGDPETMKTTEGYAKLSGYFNLDNGSGRIRGVYLQNNDAMRPLFEKWLAPFKDLGVTTITIKNTSGTDHMSFDAIGLSGFQFIQDPLDYSTVTHHSNMDTYDHAIAGDLMQASAVIAAVVYEAANLPEMLPRTPMPQVKAAN